jgi:hypothetical protein
LEMTSGGPEIFTIVGYREMAKILANYP